MILPDRAPVSQSPEHQLIDRRSVLGTLGLTGLGILASTASASAASPTKSSGAVPKISVPTSSGAAGRPAMRYSTTPDLPAEWAAQHSATANDYYRYLASLKMQRVSPRQVISAHAKSKGGVWNTLPPKVWWNREMNVNEVEIISAYRNPSYNARCAGARAGSWHQANVAVDVKFPVRASQVTSTARHLRDLGLFKGGVGGYWNFTHIDARGENINW
jgi:hypothetical protein